MIPPGDTAGLSMRDHLPMLALAALWLGFLSLVGLRDSARQQAAGAAARTSQEFYERERAGLHSLEDTDIETTEQKLDRIRRRDAASHRIP